MLTVSTICCNESEFITQFLDYTTSFADEVVIVDSGSTDGTIEMIKAYKSKVPIILEHRDLNNDFAAQRNYAKKLSSGNWILLLDIDEKFTPNFVRLLPDLMGEDVLGFSFGTYHLAQDDKHYSNTNDDPHIRLFQNREDIFFQKPIHEVLTFNGVVLSPHPNDQSALVHYREDIKLMHYGPLKSIESLKKKQELWNKKGFVELSNSVDCPMDEEYFIRMYEYKGELFTIDQEKYA